jgi:hypothetical protein
VASSPKISPQGGERLVGGDDQAGALIAPSDEHEHQVGGLRIERDIADLVADDQWVALQATQLLLQATLALGV